MKHNRPLTKVKANIQYQFIIQLYLQYIVACSLDNKILLLYNVFLITYYWVSRRLFR